MPKITAALRIPLLLTVAALLALPLTAEQPRAAFEMKLCESCRRNWDDSPSRLRVTVSVGPRTRQLHHCSPMCSTEALDGMLRGEVLSIMIVEWNARDEVDATLISAPRSWLVVGVEGDDQKSRRPYVAAFRTEKQAREAHKALGGEVLDWDALQARCRKLLEAEGERPRGRAHEREPLRPTH